MVFLLLKTFVNLPELVVFLVFCIVLLSHSYSESIEDVIVTVVYQFLKINWIGSIGEGPRDVAQC